MQPCAGPLHSSVVNTSVWISHTPHWVRCHFAAYTPEVLTASVPLPELPVQLPSSSASPQISLIRISLGVRQKINAGSF